MKILTTALLLAASVATYGINAPKKPAKKVARMDLGNQLSTYITYPACLPPTPNGAVVVVQFKVGTDNRLRRLEVFTANKTLNDDLVRQLTGRKLTLLNTDPEKVHTMRIHFQTD